MKRGASDGSEESIAQTRLVEFAQDGSARARTLLRDFPGLWAESAGALAGLIAGNQRFRTKLPVKPLDNKTLRAVALRFHEKAGTSTEPVLTSLGDPDGDSSILPFSHQPIIFPYLVLIEQF